MKVQEERVFKVPVDELRILLQNQYKIDLSGVSPYLDGEFIVFSIQMGSEYTSLTEIPETESIVEKKKTRSRKRLRKRNRIKTRGWKVLGQITNSRGLKANVYEPFVEALRDLEITRSVQKKIVRQIMIGNGNNPTDDSVEYHLDNTLEFIFQREKGVTGDEVGTG